MKGKHLVIGLILFVIIIVAVIYFSMMAEFKKDEKGMESVVPVIEMMEKNMEI
ncbi:hypothetical protein [Sporosarcina limicola]|uniref:Preprotein translocase subunit YajC n=1 Tax=Sporosarcina limicola TaxID=34101 RepID=A0A927MEI4_9BACL|nr:hypothetical protein [Sporosarcina limicola]MBE1553000.1 preprotein translocase subunit YajC [Sporosarcina limicola]